MSNTLENNAAHAIEQFQSRLGENSGWFQAAQSEPDFASALIKVWGGSPFVSRTCTDFPELLQDLWQSGDLARTYSDGEYEQRLAALLDGADSEQVLHQVLRRFRRREMIRIVWRDFSRQAATLDTTGDVTRLAEACIRQSIRFLYPRLCEQLGTPIGRDSGQPQQLVVLGMGKMGAWELNVSSDIDLIFLFPESGVTRGGKELSNQEFFIRLGQKLIQSLDNMTVDGFVFRVDMRLRPYGDSGALAINFDAFEEYLHAQGRDWERYAMIKARVVAGEPDPVRELMTLLRPFVYRKYIDFSVIQSLRDMKALINREVARLGGIVDIKKGAGGIREVEFIAQAFQLIRGGKDHRFQTQSLQQVLRLLDAERLLPGGTGERLWQAYLFLRDTEHALQGHKDQQTQRLPEDNETRACIAELMGFDDWPGFVATLEQHRTAIHEVFEGIASDAGSDSDNKDACEEARAVWLGAEAVDDLTHDLAGLGFDGNLDLVADALLALRRSKTVQTMETSVRNRLDAFMPLLLAGCGARAGGGEVLLRLLPLVQAILRRSAYLVLLVENPQALNQLIRLCGESRWIAEQVSRYPALLDELLDARSLYTPADKDSMARELRQLLLRIPEDDLEAQMEMLRYFRRAQSLRIAACEVEGALPLMKSSDNLTWLAEVILDQVMAIATRWMRSRYGNPGRAEGQTEEPSLLVVGYGKLGGIELGHGSDLDLVFLYNGEPGIISDGDKAIDNATWFSRLGQRMVHMLTTQTMSGALYEVDMRLRPNGNAGMLVTTLAAFDKYQREDAWTWEHQALVRARAISGAAELAEQFEHIRQRVLSQPREQEMLRRDVANMRDKMRVHLGSHPGKGSPSPFNIKQDRGGIVDIEFIVQYLVLLHAHSWPALVTVSDNMRLLDEIGEAQLLPARSVECLQQAYIFLRALTHRLNLQGGGSTIDEGFSDWTLACEHRQQVAGIWEEVFPPDSVKDG